MTPLFQIDMNQKRLLMFAGGPESFGSAADEPVKKPAEQKGNAEQRSQLADLANRVETDQNQEQQENQENTLESQESAENEEQNLDTEIEKSLARGKGQLEKFDANNPTEGALMQKLVEKPPEQAAVDQLNNEELTQRWEQDLVALTRSQVQDIEPGALAG